jgi:predicted dehydrogenase
MAHRRAVDLYPDKVTEKAAKHGLPVAVFADHKGLVAARDFNAVSICLPPLAHASVAADLLRSSKHVLAEKPMTHSYSLQHPYSVRRKGASVLRL